MLPTPAARGERAAPDEGELLARLRAGDEAAYALLVSSYGGRLLAVLRRLLRDEEDARDALQEAFLQAFRGLDRFQGQAQISTWLHRIAVNAALMKLRRRRSRPEESIEELLPRFLEDGHAVEESAPWPASRHASQPASAESLLERREVREMVRRAIDRLPDTYRTVLLLRDIEELDTAEVARLLGVSENAVKIRLHRARQAVRGLIDPQLREAT